MSPDSQCLHDRDDAAVWVLGAMEPGEAAAYGRHLNDCRVCCDEVDALQRVVDVLPMAAPPVRTPDGLRQRVSRGVGAEGRGRRPGRWCPRVPAALAARVPRNALAFAATGAALLTATVILAAGVTGGGSSSRVLQATVVQSPATAQLRISGGRAELIVRRLPTPPAGRIYEVWLARADGSTVPARALFSGNALGTADVSVPGQLRDVSEILVTQEPAGGSPVPTHQPVIIAPTG
jgi:anti-sigma-K factor RskA